MLQVPFTKRAVWLGSPACGTEWGKEHALSHLGPPNSTSCQGSLILGLNFRSYTTEGRGPLAGESQLPSTPQRALFSILWPQASKKQYHPLPKPSQQTKCPEGGPGSPGSSSAIQEQPTLGAGVGGGIQAPAHQMHPLPPSPLMSPEGFAHCVRVQTLSGIISILLIPGNLSQSHLWKLLSRM